MKKEQDYIDDLVEIRSLMERSSRFLSLSGMSGIFTGCYALAGALAAGWYLGHNAVGATSYEALVAARESGAYQPFLPFLVTDALSVMALTVITAVVLTQRRARKQSQKTWDASAKRLL